MSKEIDLVGTGSTNAQEWASEFMKIFGNKRQYIDEALMVTWFANAIEVAKDSTPNKQTQIWVFDDLWEEGYRFDNLDSTEYCCISKDLAKSPTEAVDVLDRIFESVPKISTDSVRSQRNVQLLNGLVLIKSV